MTQATGTDADDPGQTAGVWKPFVVGTRKVIRWEMEWRIVCATCGGGGSHKYRYRTEAIREAMRQSTQPCRCKGCNAR